MVHPPPTQLQKYDARIDIRHHWWTFVDGENGCLYGIPHDANRVLQFTLEDKSTKEIGPDLGDRECKYKYGIKANDGSIYCVPTIFSKYFLKITPRNGDAEVQILENRQLPEGKWETGALLEDGCIYYLPSSIIDRRSCVLKLDPDHGDSLSLVGEKLLEKRMQCFGRMEVFIVRMNFMFINVIR